MNWDLTKLYAGFDDPKFLSDAESLKTLADAAVDQARAMAVDVPSLEAAIRNWRGEPAVPHAHEEGKLICKCFGITDAQIIRAIREFFDMVSEALSAFKTY